MSVVDSRLDSVLKIAQALPTEGVLNLISIAGDVVRTNVEIKKENEGFLNELELLREKNASVDDRLAWLKDLLLSDALPEPAKLKLVDAICEIVVK